MSEQPLRVLLVGSAVDAGRQLADLLLRQRHCDVRIAGALDELLAPGADYHAAVIQATLLAGLGDDEARALLGRVASARPRAALIVAGSGADGLGDLGENVSVVRVADLDELARLVHDALDRLRLREAARQNQILEQLMGTAGDLLGGKSEADVLKGILASIQLLGYDRARLYLLSDDDRTLLAKAQVGHAHGIIDWGVDEYPFFRDLEADPRPHVFRRVATSGPYREWVDRQELDEWGDIPLVSGGRVIGKITVDNKTSRQPLVESDLEPLGLFASQAAAAIVNARLIASAENRAKSLASVLQVTEAVNTSIDLQTALTSVCKAAVELLGVDHSGFVLFEQDLKHGVVGAEYPDLSLVGLKVGLEGVRAEERLIREGEPIVIKDLAGEDGVLDDIRDEMLGRGIRSTLIVPVETSSRTLGSFSLETIGRERDFTGEEIDLCRNFASQVAGAIGKAQLLEALRSTTLEITSLSDRDRLLDTIIAQAAKLLRAESGGIYKYDPERRELKIICDLRRPENVGKVLAEGQGMAGRLVLPDALPWMIIDDYSAWPERAPIFDAPKPFGAVLEVPLKWNRSVIGVLYIDSPVGRRFAEEDARLLLLFADYAAIALNNDALVEQHQEQRHNLARLVASSPNGIIAADVSGRIIEFSEGAQELIWYKSEEMLGQPISRLYDDSEEARRIGRLLSASPEGKINGYETTLVRRDEERIPIRLSATWLYDARGRRIGSLGYFEDLRSILGVRAQLDLLFDASSLLRQVEDGQSVLQRLAVMMVSAIQCTFCRILLLDEDGRQLTVKAAHAVKRARQLRWNPQLGQSVEAAAYEHYGVTRGGQHLLLRAEGYEETRVLNDFARALGLERSVRSLLLVPVKFGGRVSGILELGEVREEERSSLTEEKVKLAAAIAAYPFVAVANIAGQRWTDSERLRRAARAISQQFKLREVLQSIVDEAQELLQASSCALWPYDESQQKFIPEEVTAVGVPPDEIEELRREERSPGRTAQAVLRHQRVWVEAANSGLMAVARAAGGEPGIEPLGPRTKELLRRAGIQSFEAVRLDAGPDETVGVLYVNYQQPQKFDDERALLVNLAMVAGLALKKARLLDEVSRAVTAIGATARVMALGKRDRTLTTVADGIRETLGCDAVTLYEYDEARRELVDPPAAVGVSPATYKRISSESPSNSLVYQLIELGKPYPVADTTVEPLFAGSRFTRDEGVLSSVAVPLNAMDHKVGLIFVNYRHHHKFSDKELDRIKLFADTTAVALRNVQLYEATRRRGAYLGALNKAAKSITESVGQEPGESVLDVVVREAVKGISSGKKGRRLWGDIQLYHPKERSLVYKSAHPPEETPGASIGAARRLEPGVRPVGITGRAVLEKRLQLVNDVDMDKDHIVINPATKSEVAVPLLAPGDGAGAEVVGVLNVQCDEKGAFTKEDGDTLLALGGFAAISIKNSRLIDELRRRTDRLVEEDRRKTEFFNNVSHELRTPVTDLILILDNLLDGTYGADVREDKLRVARNSAHWEKHVIEKVLDSAAILEGREKLSRSLSSVAAKIKEVRDNFAAMPISVGRNIVTRLPVSDSLTARVDAGKVQSILANLVENALKFTEVGATVTIAAARCEDLIEVSVADDGAGIAPDELPHIFERFFRSPSVVGSNITGTGLGLDIVKKYVELHGGSIEVESEQGRGTVFTFTIPAGGPSA